MRKIVACNVYDADEALLSRFSKEISISFLYFVSYYGQMCEKST